MPLTPAAQAAVNKKIQQIARRMIRDAQRSTADDTRPHRPGIPRRARPDVVLVVRRQPKAQDAAASGAPGTLVALDGERAELYVGRRRWWSVQQLAAVASRVRGCRTLTILAHTQVAGEGARKVLNQVWRLQDVQASGLVALPESVRRRLEAGQEGAHDAG